MQMKNYEWHSMYYLYKLNFYILLVFKTKVFSE